MIYEKFKITIDNEEKLKLVKNQQHIDLYKYL